MGRSIVGVAEIVIHPEYATVWEYGEDLYVTIYFKAGGSVTGRVPCNQQILMALKNGTTYWEVVEDENHDYILDQQVWGAAEPDEGVLIFGSWQVTWRQ